jgi:hypothetical protein
MQNAEMPNAECLECNADVRKVVIGSDCYSLRDGDADDEALWGQATNVINLHKALLTHECKFRPKTCIGNLQKEQKANDLIF